MTFQNRRTVKATRKPSICVHCGGVIPVGSPMTAISQHFDGEFSYCRAHVECDGLWNGLYQLLDYCGEGMDWDLAEVLGQYDSIEAQQSLDHFRGLFPHAVTRLEYRMRRFLGGTP